MCQADKRTNNGTKEISDKKSFDVSGESVIRRRSKRDRNGLAKKVLRRHRKKNKEQNSNDILITLLPSLIGLTVGIFALMAKMGFRGRATVAGIDLGTTNSVICVQQPSKSVGEIICIPDPMSNSAIIPSIVSFSDETKAPFVGQAAKNRLNTHPHSTVYHAKRIIGRPFQNEAVKELQSEVEFGIVANGSFPLFELPGNLLVSPPEIGSYVLQHLLQITSNFLGHSSVKKAVVTIPAEFSPEQRAATLSAYALAGITVLRVLEEPTAAALAYGLDKKPGVEHVLVYDFGGGTLDVSILRMAQNGYVDVMGSAGDSTLGGADFDHAIVRYIEKRDPNLVHHFDSILEQWQTTEEELMSTCHDQIYPYSLCALSSLHAIAERIKINLSSVHNVKQVTEKCFIISSAPLPSPSDNSNLCPYLVLHNIDFTYREFLKAVQHLFPPSIAPIHQILNDLDLDASDIDEVVMVGGTTRMLHIRELVQQKLNLKSLNTDIDPDRVVAYGAASVID